MTKRILFLMSDTGGGHRTAAQAVEEAIHHLYPGRYDVVIEDIWRWHTPWPINQVTGSLLTPDPRALDCWLKVNVIFWERPRNPLIEHLVERCYLAVFISRLYLIIIRLIELSKASRSATHSVALLLD